MALTCSDCPKLCCSVIIPPVGVFLEKGCGWLLCINILLTCCLYIPGLIHALYVILKY